LKAAKLRYLYRFAINALQGLDLRKITVRNPHCANGAINRQCRKIERASVLLRARATPEKGCKKLQ